MTTAAPGPYRLTLEELEASAHVPVSEQVESVPAVVGPEDDRLPQPDSDWFRAGG